MAKQVVPYTRLGKKGRKGKDILAIKRALVKQGVLDSKLSSLSNRYGPKTVAAVKKYQKNHKLRADGEYTRKTHEKLRAGKNFDAYGAKLMRDFKADQRKDKSKGAGERIASAAMYSYNRRPKHYTQGSMRWQVVDRVPWDKHMWDYGDCSAFATGCFKQAGVKNDPNGYGWRAGYTGTLCQHGQVVHSARPGDLVFYGGGPPWGHVAVAISKDKVIGHGSEGGPHLSSISYRSVGQIRRYV